MVWWEVFLVASVTTKLVINGLNQDHGASNIDLTQKQDEYDTELLKEEDYFENYLLQDVIDVAENVVNYTGNVREIPLERRRGKTLCRRRLGGRCVRRRKRCPGHLPSQTGPGSPYCSKFHRCCHQEIKPECSEADGFFKVPGSVDQCFKLFSDIHYTWNEGQSKCHEEGLLLAKPLDPVALRLFMRETYGDEELGCCRWYIGGRGTGNGTVEWVRDGSILSSSDPAWWPVGQPGLLTETDYCLSLYIPETYFNIHPNGPLDMTYCSLNFKIVCELVL